MSFHPHQRPLPDTAEDDEIAQEQDRGASRHSAIPPLHEPIDPDDLDPAPARPAA